MNDTSESERLHARIRELEAAQAQPAPTHNTLGVVIGSGLILLMALRLLIGFGWVAMAETWQDILFLGALPLLVRIPTKPAMHSNMKPATDTDLKPARDSDLMSAT